jgi:type VI secretion system secreted protein VgrG
MPLTQRDRTLAVDTPLGEDGLLLRGMTGSERISALFEYELDLVSEDVNISPSDLLGKTATVTLQLRESGQRFFNGHVNRFSHVGFDGAYALYRATLVPWLWFLSRTADCRIFQDKTVPDIVKEIFREHGFTDFEERLSGSYRTWTYCVQYRETDLNFVNRLLEQEGLYYFFEHEQGKHTLILADSYSAHAAVPGYEEVPYFPPDDTAAAQREHIDDWIVAQQVRPGAFVNTAFDFTAPRKDLSATRRNPKGHDLADFEVFDYSGDYTENADGDAYARIRLEETQAQHELAQAQSDARGLAGGALFKLTGYRREDQNREYLIVSANYQLQSDLFGSSAATPTGPLCRCSLTAMDAQVPYRPPRTTPKPIVQGPQTAIVTGKAGEEIWTDQYGRVKVQFHWDRYGKRDESSSCWIRVSQVHAGKGFGGIDIPRIGEEVIVECLEGDPDRPIVTGRVYNGDNRPPNGLPGAGMISGLKSNSTPGGGGFNQIMMDDTKGKELVSTNAQYNMDTNVGNDQTNTVGVDQTNTVGSNQTEDIGANRSVTVGSQDSLTVGASRTTKIGADQTVTVGANHRLSVGATESTTIGGTSTLQVGGSRTETVGGPHSIANPAMTVATGAALAMTAGSSLTASSPKVNLLAGSKFMGQSGGPMTLKAGAAMTQESGAAMQVKSGAAMKVNSAAAMNVKSGAAMKMHSGAAMSMKAGAAIKADASGAMSLKAGGALTGKASVIKLNSPTKIKGTTLTVS